MAGQYTQIPASDYNLIQSKIALVMGSGSGTTGYGQVLASSQVAANQKITVNQWNNLRSDILRARQHQTGTDLGSSLTTASASVKISEDDRAAYLALATAADTYKLTAPPPTNQLYLADLVGQQVKNTPWNGTISQTVVVTWPTADDARYFFNTGSEIQFSSSRTGGTAGLKNTSWSTLLTGAGIISYNINGSTTTGSGSTQAIGWYDLTTTDNLIFEKDRLSTESYYPNKYYITARVDSVTDRKIGYFTIWWEDSSLAPPSYPDPGFGIDEDVTGTLTSNVKTYRAYGSNVQVAQPSASTSSIGSLLYP